MEWSCGGEHQQLEALTFEPCSAVAAAVVGGGLGTLWTLSCCWAWTVFYDPSKLGLLSLALHSQRTQGEKNLVEYVLEGERLESSWYFHPLFAGDGVP